MWLSTTGAKLWLTRSRQLKYTRKQLVARAYSCQGIDANLVPRVFIWRPWVRGCIDASWWFHTCSVSGFVKNHRNQPQCIACHLYEEQIVIRDVDKHRCMESCVPYINWIVWKSLCMPCIAISSVAFMHADNIETACWFSKLSKYRFKFLQWIFYQFIHKLQVYIHYRKAVILWLENIL